MPFATRSDLRTTLRNWLMRPSDTTRLTDAILNDFIDLMETDAFRRLDTLEFETHNTAFAVSTEYTALPTGFKGFRRAPFVNAASRTELKLLANSDPRFLTTSAFPSGYCIEANQLRVPSPDAAYTLDVLYYGSPAPITDTTTNVLFDNNPDLYLFGSLIMSKDYTGDDTRMPAWQQRYEGTIQAITRANNRRKWQGSTGEMQPRFADRNPQWQGRTGF